LQLTRSAEKQSKLQLLGQSGVLLQRQQYIEVL
jgi:hypothetical protein